MRYDLEERLITFSVLIIDVVESLPKSRVGNHMAGQLIRSGTSPAFNYGEAQSAESRKDFVHKMKIVLKELRETSICLEIIQRKGLCPRRQLSNSALEECRQLIAIFAKSVSTAESRG